MVPAMTERELVMGFVALDEVEYHVPDVVGPTPHPTAMVVAQRLLVLGRAEEGNIADLIELIHGVFRGRLGTLRVICSDPRCSIVKVG